MRAYISRGVRGRVVKGSITCLGVGGMELTRVLQVTVSLFRLFFFCCFAVCAAVIFFRLFFEEEKSTKQKEKRKNAASPNLGCLSALTHKKR